MLLWLSYQRYALLGTALLLGLGLGTTALDHAWWAWLVVALATVTAGPLIVHIWREYPRKRQATQLATRRIANGSFRPESLVNYCGDPCWRVVAHEILRRAGTPPAERRRLVKELRAQFKVQSHALLIVDHTKGTVLHVEGGVTTHTPISRQAT